MIVAHLRLRTSAGRAERSSRNGGAKEKNLAFAA